MGARRPLSEATKAKIAAALKGKPLSEERKAKISVANTNNPNAIEARAKLSAALKGNRPWETRKTMHNKEFQHLWSLLGDVYEVQKNSYHKQQGSCGASAIARKFGYKYNSSWANMVQYCRKFPDGSWYQSKDYVDWMVHFNKAE